MKNLPEESIDLIIADPPFGIDFSGKEALYNRDKSFVADGYSEVKIENYAQFSYDWMSELPRIMKESSSAYVFSGWTNLNDLLTAVEKIEGLTLVNHIIWKYQFGVFTKKKFVSSHYHVLFLVKNPTKYYFNKITHYPQDVWDDISRKYKPGQKKNGTVLPLELVERCIDYSSKPGDLVFDPFMGNGTTAMAAKANFRHFHGFEINPAMKEIISSNIELIDLGETTNKKGSYNERWRSEENFLKLKERYPRAYQEYIKEK
ncbi:MAG: site-specific DNA-methyltransferase [Candidatus Heimdallarchaeota archaeon]|nr:site-specific DNA-methyltransferase [Candidatus Heimdallarchaeota archaeon]MCK5048161.1 site-specific DNA-methyltransferase [Candidatus Heimdallarchaeota archaeon]